MKIGRALRDTLGILGTRIVWSGMGIVSGVILARWLGPHDRGILALVLLIRLVILPLTIKADRDRLAQNDLEPRLGRSVVLLERDEISVMQSQQAGDVLGRAVP